MYKDINYKEHPNSRSNGRVREHILIAETNLNRYLRKGEVVHHIDENKLNNHPNNLMVFKSQEDHARYHSGAYDEIICINDVYICTPKIYTCEICGDNFKHRSCGVNKFCSQKCSQIYFRKCKRPSKQELYELLLHNTFVSVGEMFNVSDNAIRKWCKSYDMSTKSKDYKK